MTFDKLVTVNILPFGSLYVSLHWGHGSWYYISRKKEKINMTFFMGSVEFPDEGETVKLYQIVLGRLLISWSWNNERTN